MHPLPLKPCDEVGPLPPGLQVFEPSAVGQNPTERARVEVPQACPMVNAEFGGGNSGSLSANRSSLVMHHHEIVGMITFMLWLMQART
eukprot:SAG31_NODE_487_length_14980_cov_9.526376_10_plen_88_part_00